MAAELITIKPRLDKLNTQLVFIGSGTPAQAARFQKSLKEQVDCYVDQKCEVYKKLGCIQASLKVLLGTQSMKSYSRALLKGFMNTTVQGDGKQLGGVFVISTDGKILYMYTEKFPGDHPPFDEIVKKCE